MSIDIQMDATGIDLSRVPVTFRGGLATGAVVLAALMVEAGLTGEEITELLWEYKGKVEEVLAQVEPQAAALEALYSVEPEGTA